MSNKLELSWGQDPKTGQNLAVLTDKETNIKFKMYKFWRNKNEKSKGWKLADFSLSIEYPNGEYLTLYRMELRDGDHGLYVYDVSQLPKTKNGQPVYNQETNKQETIPTRTMSKYFREMLLALAKEQLNVGIANVETTSTPKAFEAGAIESKEMKKAKDKEEHELKEMFKDLDFFEEPKEEVSIKGNSLEEELVIKLEEAKEEQKVSKKEIIDEEKLVRNLEENKKTSEVNE